MEITTTMNLRESIVHLEVSKPKKTAPAIMSTVAKVSAIVALVCACDGGSNKTITPSDQRPSIPDIIPEKTQPGLVVTIPEVTIEVEPPPQERKLESGMISRAESPLAKITPIPLPKATKIYISSKNKAHHNGKVLQWVQKHSPEWIHKNGQGEMGYSPSELKATSQKLVQEGKLTDMSGNGFLEAYFNPHDDQIHGSGVTEDYRRVIRTQDIPYLKELYTKLNTMLLEHGLPENMRVTPVINSSVRDIKHNKSLRGSSPNSLHLSFAALDFSVKYFLLNTIKDGVITSKKVEADKNYFNALNTAMHQMGLKDKLFVRYHRAHWHVIFKSSSVNIFETQSEAGKVLHDWIRMYGTKQYKKDGTTYSTAYYLDPKKRYIIATRLYPISEINSPQESQQFHDKSRANTKLLTIERPDMMPSGKLTQVNFPVNVQKGVNIDLEHLEENRKANLPKFLKGWNAQLKNPKCQTLRDTLKELGLEEELKDFYVNGVIVKESQWVNSSSAGVSSAKGIAQVLNPTANEVSKRYKIGINKQDPKWNGKAVIANLDMVLRHGDNKEQLLKVLSATKQEYRKTMALYLLAQAHHMGQGRLEEVLEYFLKNIGEVQKNAVSPLDLYYQLINSFYDQADVKEREKKEGRIDVIRIVAFKALADKAVPSS